MSANRFAWVAAAAVVLVVGLLVFRTLRTPAPGSAPTPPVAAQDAGTERTGRPAIPDTGAARERRPSSVERAKLVLQARGYYDGPIDGNYDPVLTEAIKRFQKDSGMRPTGYLDTRTYTALGIELRVGGKR